VKSIAQIEVERIARVSATDIDGRGASRPTRSRPPALDPVEWSQGHLSPAEAQRLDRAATPTSSRDHRASRRRAGVLTLTGEDLIDLPNVPNV
jgi:hypothetical protein